LSNRLLLKSVQNYLDTSLFTETRFGYYPSKWFKLYPLVKIEKNYVVSQINIEPRNDLYRPTVKMTLTRNLNGDIFTDTIVIRDTSCTIVILCNLNGKYRDTTCNYNVPDSRYAAKCIYTNIIITIIRVDLPWSRRIVWVHLFNIIYSYLSYYF